jgi:sulfatase modifying factor 1
MPPDAHERAFLNDIVAHPDDPSLWLILADWLTDRDDPRAELVRLTWSLQYEPEHAEFATRQARVQALLNAGMVPLRPLRKWGEIEFAWIAPGSFLRVGPGETQHQVTLTQGFWLGVHPVTQGQWRAIVGHTPSYFSRNGGGKDTVKTISDDDLNRFPVESISWHDAQEFCVRLSESLGQRVGLPTEAQWEYACRAGTRTPFHFGSILNGTQANCNGNYPSGTTEKGPYLARPTPVGLETYPANAWGLFDLHGNVWEWCADWGGAYQTATVRDPLGASDGSERVVCGGSWRGGSSRCAVAYRSTREPGLRDSGLGFRLARVSLRLE